MSDRCWVICTADGSPYGQFVASDELSNGTHTVDGERHFPSAGAAYDDVMMLGPAAIMLTRFGQIECDYKH